MRMLVTVVIDQKKPITARSGGFDNGIQTVNNRIESVMKRYDDIDSVCHYGYHSIITAACKMPPYAGHD
jgi:CRISPR/Cas system-associated protein Cas7 (RAMP superfamily)